MQVALELLTPQEAQKLEIELQAMLNRVATLGRSIAVLGELTPRLAGFSPGTTLGSFAVEKRAGGHIFQLNFSNYFGSTFRQIAQGAFTGDDWYLGFNISRKFF